MRLSFFRKLYLFSLSRPKQNRLLYRTIHQGVVQRILELGVGDGQRALRMLEVAAAGHDPKLLHYTGLDLFEARSAASPGMTLKEAYRRLKPAGVKLQLLPGDPFSALSQAANCLGQFDLIVIGANAAGDAMNRAWFYVPRLLHAKTKIFVESRKTPEFRLLSAGQIERLATQSVTRRKAA